MATRPAIYAFAFSDIEGSTALLARLGDGYWVALEEHRRMIRRAAESHGGIVVDTAGDSTLVMYTSPDEAVNGCVDAQRALLRHRWEHDGGVRVRMGVHMGEATIVDGEPIGVSVHHAARVMSAAHGGQIVVSDQTRPFLHDVGLTDLGAVSLKDISEPVRLFQVVAPDLPERFPPLRAERVERGNLPRALTTFIGREDEAAAVEELCRCSAFTTITGVGGTGKTRLALHVADRLAREFPGGAWFVDLAAVKDSAFVTSTIATGLGMSAPAGTAPEVAIVALLRDKHALVLLDNCEHVSEAVAVVVRALLPGCPNVHLLVTSRQPIGNVGEQVWPLDVLPLDAAVELFVERARMIEPSFAAAIADVAELCERLDRLPLALELAAARVRTFDVGELQARVSNARSALVGSARMPERQRTLRATFDWSVRLLSEDERRLLADLSVFPGDFSIDAVEQVSSLLDPAVTVSALETLVVKSLVANRADGGQRRFRLLDFVRERAAALLADIGGVDEARHRHLEWVITWARALRDGLEGPEPALGVAELRRGEADLRIAFEWATTTHDDRRLLALVAASGPFGLRNVGVISETATWIDAALAVDPDIDPGHRLDVLTLGARLWLHPPDKVRAMADEALELARRLDNRACEALVLETRAWFMVEDGDEEGAIELAASGVEVAASGPTAAFAAWVANLLVNLLRRRGRFDEAFAVLDRIDDLSPEGLGLYEANLRYQRGNLHRALGRVDEARHWFEVALASAHRTASLDGMSMAEWGLGMLARRERDWGEATRRFRSSHDAQLRIGGRDWTTTAASLTEAELCLGHLDTSLQLLAETERLAALDDNVPSWAQYHFAAGQVRRAQGRRAEAHAHFDRVLETAPSFHWSMGLVDALHHLAEMADEDGDGAAAADYRSRAAAVPPR